MLRDLQIDLRVLRTVADGIGQQVGQGTLDHQSITCHCCPTTDLQSDPFLFGADGEEIDHPFGFIF
ncbi:hypothetical protein D3C87_1848400 [compost metagenome]